MPLAQLQRVESNLRRLGKHLPDLPVMESLILRAAIILGRDANTLTERLLLPAGLTEGEFRVLMALLAHDSCASAGDLCASLGQSPANLTRIADALVKRGYLSRRADVDDRRRMLLQLKPAGRRLLDKILPGVCSELTLLFADFSTAEKKQMLQFFQRLLSGIEALNMRAGHAGDNAA